MSINAVQCQAGLSMPEFFASDGTQANCYRALYTWRWPQGVRCPCCAGRARSRFKRGGVIYYQCSACRHQTSLIAGTMFQGTKLPLRTWMLALHLLTSTKTNMAALELMRPSPRRVLWSSTRCAASTIPRSRTGPHLAWCPNARSIPMGWPASAGWKRPAMRTPRWTLAAGVLRQRLLVPVGSTWCWATSSAPSAASITPSRKANTQGGIWPKRPTVSIADSAYRRCCHDSRRR